MAVYFIFRSHYEGPTGLLVKQFKDATVLDLYRNYWRRYAALEKALGGYVYGFDSVFEAAAEQELDPPRTSTELGEYLEEHLYVEGELRFKPHVIQALTDDDELELAYYFFDDQYLAKNAAKAAFLLRQGWELPAGRGKGGFKTAVPTKPFKPSGSGEGRTYVALLIFCDSLSLTDLEGAYRIDGVRLPGLARHLASVKPPGEDSYKVGWEFATRLLRSQLLTAPAKVSPYEKAFLEAIDETPADPGNWMGYSDWLAEQGEKELGLVLLRRALEGVSRYPVMVSASHDWGKIGLGSVVSAQGEMEAFARQHGQRKYHNPSKSLIQVEEHVAQLCLHICREGKKEMYHRWIFFDDLWASAHPDLANGILRYARRWDVLS